MSKNIDVIKLCRLSRLELDGERCAKTEEELEEFECFARALLKPYCGSPSPSADTCSPLRADTVQAYEGSIAQGYIQVPLTVGAEE